MAEIRNAAIGGLCLTFDVDSQLQEHDVVTLVDLPFGDTLLTAEAQIVFINAKERTFHLQFIATTPPRPGAVSTRDWLYAAIQLLEYPRRYCERVSERITVSDTELVRHVTACVRVPQLGGPRQEHEPPAVTVGSAPFRIDNILVPVLRRNRGEIPRHFAIDIDGVKTSTLSHSQHHLVAKSVLFSIFFSDVLAKKELRSHPTAVSSLGESFHHICKAITDDELDPEPRATSCDEAIEHMKAAVRKWGPTLNAEACLSRLINAVRILSFQYIVVAQAPVQPGDHILVNYEFASRLSKRLKFHRLNRFPSEYAIPIPLATRAHSYDLMFEGPDGFRLERLECYDAGRLQSVTRKYFVLRHTQPEAHPPQAFVAADGYGSATANLHVSDYKRSFDGMRSRVGPNALVKFVEPTYGPNFVSMLYLALVVALFFVAYLPRVHSMDLSSLPTATAHFPSSDFAALFLLLPAIVALATRPLKPVESFFAAPVLSVLVLSYACIWSMAMAITAAGVETWGHDTIAAYYRVAIDAGWVLVAVAVVLLALCLRRQLDLATNPFDGVVRRGQYLPGQVFRAAKQRFNRPSHS